MKTTIRKTIWTNFAAMAFILTLMVVGCKKKEDDTPTPVPTPDPLKSTYTLKAKDIGGISGTVTFTENGSQTTVSISITGPFVNSGSHPANIYSGAAVEGSMTGAISLTPVDASGKSSTVIAQSYSTLTNYDGYINIYLSSAMDTILAQADIGGNNLTGTNKIYNLDTIGSSNIKGTAKFEQRINNTTLLTITISTVTGDPLPPGMYPAKIFIGTILTIGAPVTKTLNDINSATGRSITNIRNLDPPNSTAITYTDWLNSPRFIRVFDPITGNPVCQGNIGM